MIPLIPKSIELVMLATNVVAAMAVWSVFSAAAGQSGLVADRQRRLKLGVGLYLGLWLGAALLLAPAPETVLSRDPFTLTPLIPAFLLGSIGIALLTIRLSPSLRRVLAALSLPAIVGVQFYRAIGAIFVILLALGQLPAYFALPAGWGDVAVGLAAPLVALALARNARGSRTIALGWNVFGLLDLIVAVGMGTGLLAPVLVPGLGPRVESAAAMGVYPMILVPTFLVPLSVLLHGIALVRLVRPVKLGLGFSPRAAA
jgi:hypothetical protein